MALNSEHGISQSKMNDNGSSNNGPRRQPDTKKTDTEMESQANKTEEDGISLNGHRIGGLFPRKYNDKRVVSEPAFQG